ncbi:MAG: amidohydrolase family protein [Rhodospirillaceae bacterium]|nr:amidohydrolase family protein [Rhodospirillaceae bacterium]
MTRVSSIPLLLAVCGAVCAVAAVPVQSKDLLIRNVTLYDGTGAAAQPNTDVLVKNGKIAQVSAGHIKARAAVIDGTDKFLMPGLIDSHIHLPGGQVGAVTAPGERKMTMDKATATKTLHGYLYSGVTSIYDSGNNTDFIFAMRADERAGKITAPRIFAGGGTISVPGGYASGASALKVADWDQAKADLDARFAYKPDMLKLILDRQGLFFNKAVPTFTPEAFKRVVDYAHANGVRATVHISAEWDAETAIAAGVDALAHPVMRSLANDEFVGLAAARKIPISTTIVVFNNIARVADDPGFFDEPLMAAVIEPAERERGKTSERQRYITSGMSPMFKLMVPYALDNIRRLHQAGAVLALGTDRAFGPAVHQELELLAKAGVPAFDCIQIATLNNAKYLGKEAEMGSVTPGKMADLLLLDADPAQDVKNFRAISAVIKDGQRIDLAALDLPVNHRK